MIDTNAVQRALSELCVHSMSARSMSIKDKSTYFIHSVKLREIVPSCFKKNVAEMKSEREEKEKRK